MFQETEIINLILGIIAVLLLFFLMKTKKGEMPEFRSMYIGFYCIIGALVFTVIEGVAWKKYFNILEHLCYMLAGILFAHACYKLSRKDDNLENDK